jgi:N-acetylglutamate synthase-like GNAT family acetyltransferase
VTSPEAVLTGNDVTGSEVDYIKGVQGNPRVSHTKQQKDRSRSESYEESQDEFTIQGEDEPITSGEHAIEVVDGRWKICRTHRMEWYEESGPEIWENDKVPSKSVSAYHYHSRESYVMLQTWWTILSVG